MGGRRGPRSRRWLAFVGGGVLVLFLGGCLFVYDASSPQVTYRNLSDQVLMVSIDAPDRPIVRPVSSHGGVQEVGLDECFGTEITVETEDGELIGRVDEPACPGWTLTINEDYSLTYTKD